MSGSAVPPEQVPIRPAATVVLVRDGHGAAGLEVFLLRRHHAMDFAAGMSVFPGGGLDPDDDGDLARTAARELFEECGVLLASEGTPAAPTVPGADWTAQRAAVEAHTDTFSGFLRAAGLALRTDLLMPFARWVTPIGPRRRYDTAFFLAALPAAQSADGKTSEAVSAGWISPAAALAEFAAGRHELMAPTYSALFWLKDLGSAAQAARHLADYGPQPPVLPIPDADPSERNFPGVREYYETRATRPRPGR